MFKIFLLSLLLANNSFAASSNILNVGNAGMNGTDWAASAAFTFSGLGTVSSDNKFCRRIGDSLHCRGTVIQGTASGTAQIDLSSLTIALSKHSSSVSGQIVGTWNATDDSSATDLYGTSLRSGVLFIDGSDNNSVFFAARTSTSGLTKLSGGVVNNSQEFSYDFTIPISGWTTQAGLNTRILSFAFAGNSSGSANCTSSPCTNVSNPSSDVTNATRGGSGDYTINFSRSFSSQPVCTAIANNVGTGQSKCSQVWTSGSGSSVRIACETDSAVTLICSGY